MTSSLVTSCQALGVSPALVRMSSCLKCTQLVGDSAQSGPLRDSLTVGLSCCSAPSNLGTVWVEHSRPLLSALNSLQGVHVMLVDSEDTILKDVDIPVTVNNTE